MLRSLIERPVSVAIGTLVLVVVGVVSLLRIPVSLLPSLERPRLVISAQAEELSRQELQEKVVEPLERRLTALAGVLEVHSLVDDGVCSVALETEWQTDVDRLRIDIERRLADVAGLGLDELSVVVESGDRQPVIEIAVLGGASEAARTTFADRVLIPELGHLEGVGRLRRIGGAQLRPVVRPQAAALAARQLTAVDIVQRLQGLGLRQPLGRLRDGGHVRPLVLFEEVTSLQELAELRLGPQRGTALGDVASLSFEEVPEEGLFRLDGQQGVLVEVHRAPGANAVLLARQVKALHRELLARPSGGLDLEIVRDGSGEVLEALRQLGLAACLGLVFGALVLRLLLGSWRPTLALAVVVPASIVAAFSGFYLWDVSLDIVSLAGLALAAGMLVDNSIVVLESIESARRRGVERPEVEGSEQIALALVASFLTTAVVFLPLIYLQGLARAFFGVQAFAIVTTLAISLLLSLTLTPVLARRTSAQPGPAGRSPGRALYRRLLQASLGHPWVVLCGVAVVLAIGALALQRLDRQLIPQAVATALEVEFRLPAGLDHGAVRERVEALEQPILQQGLFGQRLKVLYRGADGQRQEALEATLRGTLELTFSSPQSAAETSSSARPQVAPVAGLQSRLRWRRSAIASAAGTADDNLRVEVASSSRLRAEVLARRVIAHLVEYGVHLSDTLSDGDDISLARPAYELRLDGARLARNGFDEGQILQQVRQGLGGRIVGRMAMARGDGEILVEATEPRDLELLPVRLGSFDESAGEAGVRVVSLSALGTLQRRSREPPWLRRNGRPAVLLEVDAKGSALSPGELTRQLDQVPQAIDERVRLRGQAWEMQRSFGQLRLALGLAMLLVFLTVAALFESLSMPWVVMTTVPLAAAGALVSLALSGQSLNVMSFLGLILLAGIVVNNAIVLVHRGEQRVAQGEAPRQAILEAASERYRPILMTTLTTLLGMVPLAVLGGQGVELRRALAIAVGGGLATSMVAALVVVPVLYLAWVRPETDHGA